MKKYIAIDIGGSLVKYAILDETCKILDKSSVPTEKSSLIEFKKQIIYIIKDICEVYYIEGIGISAPGSVDYKNKIIYGSSALPFIHDNNWIQELEDEIEIPIEVENDGNCAIIAEHRFGNGIGADNIVNIVIGTGFGGAIITNNKLLRGRNLLAGEFAYSIIDLCNPIKMVNDSLSTQSLINEVNEYIPVKNGFDVYNLYDNGNVLVTDILEQYFTNLASFVININSILDPDKILVGGGISSRSDFISNLKIKYDSIQESLNCKFLEFNVEKSYFENDANLIGAVLHFSEINKKN